jgi:hypothetical protein
MGTAAQLTIGPPSAPECFHSKVVDVVVEPIDTPRTFSPPPAPPTPIPPPQPTIAF